MTIDLHMGNPDESAYYVFLQIICAFLCAREGPLELFRNSRWRELPATVRISWELPWKKCSFERTGTRYANSRPTMFTYYCTYVGSRLLQQKEQQYRPYSYRTWRGRLWSSCTVRTNPSTKSTGLSENICKCYCPCITLLVRSVGPNLWYQWVYYYSISGLWCFISVVWKNRFVLELVLVAVT